jgi:hypothetical protein
MGASRARGLIEFRSGGLHEKQRVATWNLEIISICLYTEESHEDLCRDGLSQDLPDTH